VGRAPRGRRTSRDDAFAGRRLGGDVARDRRVDRGSRRAPSRRTRSAHGPRAALVRLAHVAGGTPSGRRRRAADAPRVPRPPPARRRARVRATRGHDRGRPRRRASHAKPVDRRPGGTDRRRRTRGVRRRVSGARRDAACVRAGVRPGTASTGDDGTLRASASPVLRRRGSCVGRGRTGPRRRGAGARRGEHRGAAVLRAARGRPSRRRPRRGVRGLRGAGSGGPSAARSGTAARRADVYASSPRYFGSIARHVVQSWR